MSTDQILDQTVAPARVSADQDAVPDYLRRHYTWAYLHPLGKAVFDHPAIVSAILWGNYHALMNAALVEAEPGQRVLQTACVYGEFSKKLAERLGADGHLDVIDVAATQVELCRKKLRAFGSTARISVMDARTPPPGPYERVFCFFLLHEVPEDYKTRIVDAVLDRAQPGGKVVFVDYHRPAWYHPLKPLMRLVFAALEPFAHALWRKEIADYASAPDLYTWTKSVYFGGLYQKVVVERK